jgi:hypothetical protein
MFHPHLPGAKKSWQVIDVKAEVVELADTPSMALGLLVLSKFLIAALLSFTPISYADPLENGP